MKKSIFLFFAAILCAMGVQAVNMTGGEKLYLTPSSDWKTATPRYAAYFYNSSGNTWVSMAAVEGQTDLFEVTAPAGDWANVIFCRMNPETTENNWDNKWNQTGDLTYDGTKNYYTVSGWDGGSWSVYPPATTEPEEPTTGTIPEKLYLKPNSNWKDASARFAAYFFVGETTTWVSMTAVAGEDGIYEVTVPTDNAYTTVILCRMNPDVASNSWDAKWNQTGDLTIPTDGKNLFTIADGVWDGATTTWSVYTPSETGESEPEPAELTYNVTVPEGTNTCYIVGDMTGWSFTEMTKVDETHYTITIEGAKKTDGYKYTSGADWGYVEKDANGDEIGNRTYQDGNDVVASWAAVYDPDAVEQELTYSVTVPEGTYACYIAMDTDPAQEGWEFNEMTKVDDTHYTFTRTGLKNKTYKYTSGPGWQYVEQTAEAGNVADRQWAEEDIVAKWAVVYNPNATPVTAYTVTVPAGTEKCYIVGDFAESNWNTFIEMTRVGTEDKFTIEVGEGKAIAEANTANEYKYSASQGWENEEVDASNNSVSNRTWTANDVVVKWKDIALTSKLTYTVTVPEGTEKCYIVGGMNGWNAEEAIEMTSQGNNIFSVEITGVTTDTEYKYLCDKDWAYEEKNAQGESISNRKWTENDVVEAWGEPADPAEVKCYLMGNGDWENGVEMTLNPDDDNEYMLLDHYISAPFKFKLGDEWSDQVENSDFPGIQWVDEDEDGNYDISLPEGIYDFYFKKDTKKVYIAEAGYVRNVTNKYGTICLPYAAASTTGATFFEVVGQETGKVYLASVTKLEAGVPYIFEKSASQIKVVYTGEKTDEAQKSNGLYGVFEECTVGGSDQYILYNDQFRLSDGTAMVAAYRAYLVWDEIAGGKPQQMPGRRYIGMDVQGENETTGIEDLFTTDAPVKVIENGQLIIIRDGVKYNVQGQMIR